MNHISQDYLIRPMGYSSLLIMWVLSVCSYIMSVMKTYQKDEALHCPFLDQMLALDIKGGQFSDGSQQRRYPENMRRERSQGSLIRIKKEYIQIEDIGNIVDEKLGNMPAVQPWKNIVNNPAKEELLKTYFTEIKLPKARVQSLPENMP